MTKLPQYQLQMTVDSAYMAKVGVLRTGLCAGHPALKEILVSLVRGQLMARLTHVIDDDNTARYLESRTVEDAILRTVMSAGDTHFDAIGTSRDELLSNDVWSTRTQTFRYPPTNLLLQPCGERPWIQRKLFGVQLRTSISGRLLKLRRRHVARGPHVSQTLFEEVLRGSGGRHGNIV